MNYKSLLHIYEHTGEKDHKFRAILKNVVQTTNNLERITTGANIHKVRNNIGVILGNISLYAQTNKEDHYNKLKRAISNGQKLYTKEIKLKFNLR